MKITTMYIVVSHEITNTEDFWTAAQKHLAKLPEAGVKRIVSLYSSQSMNRCTSVWEADTMENLEKYFKEKMGSHRHLSCYEINEAAAFGPGL